MIWVGLLVGSLSGLNECLWLSGGPAGWTGLGRALFIIVLLYAAAGAVLAPIFSWLWRRLPIAPAGNFHVEGLVFGLLFGSALLAVDVNRFMPEGMFEAKSLVADGILAAGDLILLWGILRLARGAARVGHAGRPAGLVPAASGLCAVLVLAGTSANAWLEASRGAPLARTALVKAALVNTAPTWEIPPPDVAAPLGAPGVRETPVSHPRHPRLVLIGLDGATWSVVRPLMESGRLPNLAALLAGGVGGVMRSSDDAFSPIVWTTLFTGKSPARHGIDRLENAQSGNRRVHALWDILSESGSRVLAANAPGSYPAQAIRGVMLAGFPNETETGNNLGYLFTTRASAPRDPLSGLRVERLELAGTPGDAPATLRIQERTPLPGQSAIVSAIQAASRRAGSALGDRLLKTYVTLEVRRIPRGLRFEPAGCEGCGFDLEGGWSPWIVIERDRRPLAFRIRLVEATSDATSIYVTPLFLMDRDQQAFPATVTETLEPVEGPYLVEGSGWLYFRNPRLLDPLAEHLFGVARDQTRCVTRLWRAGEWDALIHVITLTDRVQHSFWSLLDPHEFPRISAPDPYPTAFPAGMRREDYARVIPRAYEWADRKIGRFIAGLPPETLIAIVSDHGFRSGASRIPGAGIHDADGLYILSGAGVAASRAPGAPPAPDGPVLQLTDVLPTILPLIGMPVASDFDGTPAPFVEEILKRQGRTLARIPSFDSREGWTPRAPSELDQETLDQLRSLGYVE